MTDTSFIFERVASSDRAATCGGSSLISLPPNTRLLRYVESIWFWSGRAQIEERLLPTARMQLIVEIDRPELPATMFGVESVPSTVTSSRACVGVFFRPGGAYPFLRMSAGELLDTALSLDVM